MSVRGANCFRTQFSATATNHNIVNAYLLMMVSRLTFPDQFSSIITNRADFEERFKNRFTPLGIEKFDFIHDSPTMRFDTNGIIMSNDKVVIVAFRGTEFRAGWAKVIKDFIETNLNRAQTHVPDFGNDAKVHTGFWLAFHEVRNSVINAVRAQRTANQKVWVTGHSLGGAQAILAAKTLKQERIPVQGLYTFGCPRIGNEAFKVNFGIANTQRYVYALDLVPMLPDDIVRGYRHIGRTNNFHLPFLPGAGPYDSTLKLNDSEIRGIGNPEDHHLQRYEAAFFHHLSATRQAAVPRPALQQ